jgi:hypothetical protein
MIAICKRYKRERKIYAKELCISCYQYNVNKKNSNYKNNLKRYQKKNLKYWREYMRKYNKIPKSKWRKE